MKRTKKRMIMIIAPVATATVCLLISSVLTGCISGRKDIAYGAKGPVVGHDTLRQVRVGETSKEWLLGTLGEPSSASQTPDGTEVLKYEYVRKVDSRFEVAPVLDLHDKTEQHTSLYFELKDGVVAKFWKEK